MTPPLKVCPCALLLESGDAFAARQLGGNISGGHSGGGPQHQQMIEQIGALADECGRVLSNTLDDRFNRLLTELLSNLRPAAGEEPRGIGSLRIGAAA